MLINWLITRVRWFTPLAHKSFCSAVWVASGGRWHLTTLRPFRASCALLIVFIIIVAVVFLYFLFQLAQKLPCLLLRHCLFGGVEFGHFVRVYCASHCLTLAVTLFGVPFLRPPLFKQPFLRPLRFAVAFSSVGGGVGSLGRFLPLKSDLSRSGGIGRNLAPLACSFRISYSCIIALPCFVRFCPTARSFRTVGKCSLLYLRGNPYY